jgi:hypothetical protein
MTHLARPTAETTPLPDLVLYSRAGCHLCDLLRDVLTALLREREAADLPVPRLVERDITTNADWEQRYATTIPVVEYGNRRLELATSPARLRRLIGD